MSSSAERPKPKFKVGDQVTVNVLRGRWIVKEVSWFSYGKEWEYIITDEHGREYHNPRPLGVSSFIEGQLRPAESRLLEYARMQKTKS